MLRLLVTVIGFLLAAAAQAAAIRAEPELQPAAKAAPITPKARQVDPAHVFGVVLDRPSPEEIASNLAPPGKSGAPLQVGFGRDVAALAGEAALRRALKWQPLATGGRAAAIGITSPEASAMRIGVRVTALPADAALRFYAPASGPVFEVPAREILDTIARNVAAGDASANARTYWAPVIEGATAVIEVELAATSSDNDLHIAIPEISHFVTSAAKDYVMPKSAAACENDVMCHLADWGVESTAVARMIFCDGPKCYYCTGTLLADLDTSTAIPYFLSANHCISTQTVASTLQTDWFYRSSACNSGVAGTSQTLTGGATLLYASTNTDTSFMRLNATPPAGTAYAGWIVGTPPAVGTDIVDVHHPAGDLQKISFGDVQGYWTCTAPRGGRFSCSVSTLGSATFYGVTWRSGVVEGGSSGSALFDDAGQYVIGQLYGGSSSCTNQTATDYFGRFDVAYNAALSQWLAAVPLGLTAVASRKSHSAAGTFDLALDASAPVSGAVTVEPRASGTAGHSVVFSFNAAITSAGTVSSTGVNGDPIGTPSASVSGSEILVSLSGIPDATRVKVSLVNVNGTGGTFSASLGLLVGDVDNSRATNSVDVDAVKSWSGLEVDATNYVNDFNLSGAVTAADILAAKGRVGLAL